MRRSSPGHAPPLAPAINSFILNAPSAQTLHFLQPLTENIRHSGLNCTLYPVFNLATQRVQLLRRGAHHHESPFTCIQTFTVTTLANRHRRVTPVALVNPTHPLTFLLQRTAAGK